MTIQVRNLTKRFGDFTAVDDVSFEIAPGETFALLGPNGSGKTTTLKCLIGLSLPTSGQVLINGIDLQKQSRQARQQMSFLPQRLNFHESLTAREVMEFYCSLRKLPRGRIDDVLHNSHFDFNGFSHKPISALSGGMVQRLGLAVACLPDTPILLLDEPTVSLDPEGAVRFREFLASLKAQGKTIVFSSHVLADVERLADRVAIMVDGKLAAVESIETLREDLMLSCQMWVTVRNPHPGLIDAAREAGAGEVTLHGNSIVITSRADQRMAILQALEKANGQVERLTTEELSLEDVYLKYIGS